MHHESRNCQARPRFFRPKEHTRPDVSHTHGNRTESNGWANTPKRCASFPPTMDMSKSQRTNREVKKQAVLTPKEKKAAKKAKKHAGDVVPIIVKRP